MKKTCANHPERPASAACKVCEKNLCQGCSAQLNGKVFCSTECIAVYKEVTHWIEKKSSPEEWNPLAEGPAGEASIVTPPSEPAIAALPKDDSLLDAGGPPPPDAPAEETLTPPPAPSEDPSLTIRHREEPAPAEATCAIHPEAAAVGSCAQCAKPFCTSCVIEMSWGRFCSVECSIVRPPAELLAPPPPRKRPPVYWIAGAAALVVAAVVLLLPPHKDEPSKPEPVVARMSRLEPAVLPSVPRTEAPKPLSVKLAPPVEPAKVEPTKIVVPPVEPKPEPVKVEPPKPPEKVAPREDPPARPTPTETPRTEVVKVDPPKPPVVETTAPDPPKPPPVVVVPPRAAPPAVNVAQSLETAATLIREVAPLFKEIADGLDENASERGALRALLPKVDRVRKNLREARQLYLDIGAAAPDPALIDARIRRIDSLLETTAGCLDQIKSRL